MISQRSTIDLFGFAIFRAWIALILIGPIVPFDQYSSDHNLHLHRFLMYAVLIVSFLFVRIVAKQLINCKPNLLAGIALMLSIYCALPIFFNVVSMFMLTISFWVAAGVIDATLFMLWYKAQSKIEYNSKNIFPELSYIVAGLLYMAISFLVTQIQVFVISSLPVLSIVLFSVNNNATNNRYLDVGLTDKTDLRNTKSSKTIYDIQHNGLFLVVYSISFGLAGSFITIRPMPVIAILIVGISHITAGLIVISILSKSHAKSFRLLVNCFLPCVTVCIFMLGFLSGEARYVCLFFMLLCFFLYDNVCWEATSFIETNRSANDIKHYASKRLCNLSGHFFGWGVGTLTAFYIDQKDSLFVLFCLVVLIITFTSISFYITSLADADYMNTEDRHMAKREGTWVVHCKSIADECGLSERQKQVFYYLAKGRNVKYISEKLFVSDHTIKSHVYAIYKKANIKSQQELINLVEERYHNSESHTSESLSSSQ